MSDETPTRIFKLSAFMRWMERLRHGLAIRYDVPFSGQDSYAALPWIIAFMIFLTILSLAVAVNVQRMAVHWQEINAARLTMYVPAAASKQQETDAVKGIIATLSELDGVADVIVMDEKALQAMLRPWLGDGDVMDIVPMPTLVEIVLSDDVADAEEVRSVIARSYPDIQVDDHTQWIGDFQTLVNTIKWCAFGIVLGIAFITIVILAMSTRTELSLHSRTLELLRSLGAEKRYIAKQFQANAVWMSVRGIIAGSVAAMIVLYAVADIAKRIDAPFLPVTNVSWMHWLMMVVVGCAGAMLVVTVARITAIRRLQSLDRI